MAKKILIIEDSSTDAAMVKELLKKEEKRWNMAKR